MWLKLASGSVLLGLVSGLLFTWLVDFPIGYAASVALVHGLAALAIASSLLFIRHRMIVLIIGGVPLWLWTFALGIGGVDPTPILPSLSYAYSIYVARNLGNDHPYARGYYPVRYSQPDN